MKRSVHQLVVLASGEVRWPEGRGEVAHGHVSPDQQIKIVMPADKAWILVEVEVEPAAVPTPSIASRMPK